ncbi:MAG: heparinase II/III family protein [Xanthomonadales bacterium]|nr:heparinase II/III family protein [Xanthomonadales bacterium]
MNRPTSIASLLFCLAVLPPAASQAGDHPKVILTQDGVQKIRAALGSVPLFDQTLARAKAEVDAEIEAGIDTPIPKDYSGGYTHERHKRNFFVMQKAGALYQILDDEKYARYVRDMLFQYEAMYKDLPVHPKTRSYARGKLFWQCLNDANWLVYTSQAYDAIHDYLSAKDRQRLEDNLFRPFADHISVVNPRFFNRVHNHSTWATAAVGMIGLVMGDDELIERALYGIPFGELDTTAKDDDGGFFFVEGQEAGFLANLAEPFSPDGYYTEGPYYQRYAMYPFLIFAQGLHNAKPELEVFQQQDGVLLKAVDALLNLSDARGDFFPLNDGQKGMSYNNSGVVSAVNIAFLYGGGNPGLLSIAQEQGQVLLDDAGIAVALAIRDGRAKPYEKKSVKYSDGPKGMQGGVAVLRAPGDEIELVFKYTAQGLSHGHYDKLSFSLHEKGDEVLQDYGLVRFVNIEQKGGGNYLPENTTWAKQTIAHNTLTQNATSHFQGKYEIGSQHHSDLYFYDDSNPDVQVVSATDSNAYPGTVMQRTMALISQEGFEKPFVLDIFKVSSASTHQYDLPYYYMGQVMQTNFEYDSPSPPGVLGSQNGYQHLLLEGKGVPASGISRFSWMGDRRFYTLTSVADDADQLLFTRIGANDPDFNLRRDAGFLIRRNDVGNTLFATVVESHGGYDPVSESATNSNSFILALGVVHDDEDYTAVSIEDLDGQVRILALSNSDASASTTHKLKVDGKALSWTGPYGYFEAK